MGKHKKILCFVFWFVLFFLIIYRFFMPFHLHLLPR